MLTILDDAINASSIVHISEIIKDRLYFATLNPPQPKTNTKFHYFSIDEAFVYESFYADFGPLNMAMLYRYCWKLNKKLKLPFLSEKIIVHYTSTEHKKRVNAAFLIGSYAIIYLKKTPDEVQQALGILDRSAPTYVSFRDASVGASSYQLSLYKCLCAIHKAVQHKLLDFEKFDVTQYEYYERVEKGDLNWIVPEKFIAFCGPHQRSRIENGYPLHSPESYFAYFLKHNVSTIIRLNKKVYEAAKFVEAGFEHKDLFFVDGSTPSDAIMREFLQIVENAQGAIAVHCKAGLGRTGTLIACYIMKHFRFTAGEAIAWIRICRPGSIIGHQQHWLEDKESYLWLQGYIYSNKKAANAINNNNNVDSKEELEAEKGSSAKKNTSNSLNQILSRVDQIKLQETDLPVNGEDTGQMATRSKSLMSNLNNNNNSDEEGNITQGDQLNRIKALRRHPRSATSSAVGSEDLRLHRRASSQPFRVLPTSSSGASYASPLKSVRAASGRNATASLPGPKGSPVSPKRSARTVPAPTAKRSWSGSNHVPPLKGILGPSVNPLSLPRSYLPAPSLCASSGSTTNCSPLRLFEFPSNGQRRTSASSINLRNTRTRSPMPR